MGHACICQNKILHAVVKRDDEWSGLRKTLHEECFEAPASRKHLAGIRCQTNMISTLHPMYPLEEGSCIDAVSKRVILYGCRLNIQRGQGHRASDKGLKRM